MNLRNILETKFTELGLKIPFERGIITNTEPPYIVYISEAPESVEAENINYYQNESYRLEYYWTKKSSQIENAIETAFDESGIFWDKSGDIYIQSEKLWVTYYYI